MKDKLFFETVSIGEEIWDSVFFEQEKIDLYIKISGDNNSIHQGANAIVPGALVLCTIAGVISSRFADGSMVTEIISRFKRPLYVNNYAFVIIKVKDKKEGRGGRGIVRFDVNVVNKLDKVAVIGAGEVWVEKKQLLEIKKNRKAPAKI